MLTYVLNSATQKIANIASVIGATIRMKIMNKIGQVKKNSKPNNSYSLRPCCYYYCTDKGNLPNPSLPISLLSLLRLLAISIIGYVVVYIIFKMANKSRFYVNQSRMAV